MLQVTYFGGAIFRAVGVGIEFAVCAQRHPHKVQSRSKGREAPKRGSTTVPARLEASGGSTYTRDRVSGAAQDARMGPYTWCESPAE
jgi:hypothetical protein